MMATDLTDTDLAAVGLPPRKPECWTCSRQAKWMVVSHWRIEGENGVNVVQPTKRFVCHFHVDQALVAMIEFGPDVKVMRA